jgi:hypothetical protein
LRDVSLSVKDSQNLYRIRSGPVDDEIGVDPVENNVPARQIGAAVSAVGDVRQSVQTFKQVSDHPIRLSKPSFSKK